MGTIISRKAFEELIGMNHESIYIFLSAAEESVDYLTGL